MKIVWGVLTALYACADVSLCVMQSSCVWVWPGLAVLCRAIDPYSLVVCRVPVSKHNEPEHLPFPLLLFVALQAKQPSQKLNTGRLGPSHQLTAVPDNVPRGSS